MKTENINIASLLSTSSLSSKAKLSVSHKLTKLLNTIETIYTEKNASTIEIDESLLAKEIKTTAKAIVKKSDNFQRKILESTLKQKEQSMEMLEISKLRVEAQMKDLQKKKNALTEKSTNSFFLNLKNNIFKLFNINLTKSGKEPLTLDDKLKSYSIKLYNYELEKRKIAQNFSETGSQKLAFLRKQTYYALSSSKAVATPESIQSIKEKIKNI